MSQNSNNTGASRTTKLRETKSFINFPWLNGIALEEGSMEDYVVKYGEKLQEEQDAFLMIKVRYHLMFLLSKLIFSLGHSSKPRLIRPDQGLSQSIVDQTHQGLHRL
jgi:hypothetical protein